MCELMSEPEGSMVAIMSVSTPYSAEMPSLSSTTLPDMTQSRSEARTLWSIRLTSST